jgi:hypothetical protein
MGAVMVVVRVCECERERGSGVCARVTVHHSEGKRVSTADV